MPIYAYKCDNCGHASDVLQKISDPVLTLCPACGQSAYKKQLTAAGFQLKGSGWYVTDFREGSSKSSDASKDVAKDASKDASKDAAKESAASPAPVVDSSSAADKVKSTPAPAPVAANTPASS